MATYSNELRVIKSILTFFALFTLSAINAQETTNNANAKITGKVVDSISRLPVEYAAITLYVSGSKKTVNGTTTDKTGNFTITNIDAGTYTLVAEFISYKPYTINNVKISKKNEVIDVKNIALFAKAATLQNVIVTAQGKIIENKIDKMVFNAERDLTSQTGVAADVLKKVPQVTVGIDGNVELSGSSSIRFLINGKPSSAFGSSITDVLQAIPANQIKSIEVITNPGAKYDAQGLGGIINIILKTNNAQGYNGNMSLTAGTRFENGSFNFNARKGKFGVNAFISGNARLTAKTPSSSDRLTSDTAANTKILLQQEGASDIRRNGFQTGIGFDWTFKEKNSFSGSLAYNHFGNDGNGYTNQAQDIMDKQGNDSIISNILSVNNINNAFRFNNVDASLNYKRIFNKENQELEIAFNSTVGNSRNRADNNQFLLPQNLLYYSAKSNNPGTEKENEIKLDYTHPINKDVTLGVGGKVNFMDISSTSNVLRLQSNTYIADPFLSNNLDYHQKVYAAYSELSFPIAKFLDVKIGERYERTEINAFYSNAAIQKKIPGYNTFVPSVYFSKKLGDKGGTIKLSYSKRIERPDYGDLNPFVNTTDPKNITAGNSNLLPETGKRYELGYNRDLGKTGSFMVNLFYRLNENDIQPFVVFYPSYTIGDSAYTNVAVSTRQNIGTEKNVGVNLFSDLRLISKMSIRTNLFFFHRNIINAIDKGYNSTSLNYRFNLNASYQFSNTLAAEFFGNFNSPRNEAQGKYPSFTTYSFAIRKQFWNKNGSLALTANNPFKENVDQRTSIFGPQFVVNSVRSIPFRSFGINFTWKFGKLEFKKDKEKEENLNPSAEQ